MTAKDTNKRPYRVTKTDRLIELLSAAITAVPVGSRFASDSEVCHRYNVSLPTARTALAELVRRGMIRRVAARGTFVESHTPVESVRPFKIVVFSCMGSSWYPHGAAVCAIEGQLRQDRHELVLRDNEHTKVTDIERIGLMIDDALRQADGVIWISAFIEERPALPELLKRQARKVVFVNLRFADPLATSVMRDDRGGMLALTEHAIQLGHRRLAYLGGPERRAMSQARYRGFCEAMQAHGIPLDSRWQKPFLPEISHETAYWAMEELLDLPERPTVCLCLVDTMAYGALARLKERGLRVPEDMAVTGFDNAINPECPNILTTAALAFDEIGRQAAERLTSQLHGRTRPGTVSYVPCPLVIRGSTDVHWKPAVIAAAESG